VCVPLSRSRDLLSIPDEPLALADDAYPANEHLNPVPSILDLPSLVDDSAVSASASASLRASSRLKAGPSLNLRQRALAASLTPPESPTSATAPQLPPPHISSGSASSPHRQSADGPGAKPGEEHKDADVLTKVTVYMGIGWIATIGLPWAFARAGLSVWLEG